MIERLNEGFNGLRNVRVVHHEARLWIDRTLDKDVKHPGVPVEP